MTAAAAISTLRRDTAVGYALRAALLIVLVAGMTLGDGFVRTALLVAVAGTWMALSVGSRRGQVLASMAAPLIASGQFDEAEQHIGQALRSFSLSRQGKLLSLHHLAMLRHAQRRWPEAVALCRALVDRNLGSLSPLGRSARLVLAEGLLELGELYGAHGALSELYRERLPLGEAVRLLSVQLDYEARVGAWHKMLDGLPAKLRVTELMPAPDAGRTHALLALAARRVGQADVEAFLCRRAGLLTDVQELTERRPALRELWTTTP